MTTFEAPDFLIDLSRADEHHRIDVSTGSVLTLQAFPDGGNSTGVSAVAQVWTSLGFDGGEVVRKMQPVGSLDLSSGQVLSVPTAGRTSAFVSVTTTQAGRPAYRVRAGLYSSA
jgi:hypothetical protein